MTATAATGPGGPRLESQVGATYLLALLLRAEPRGLTGTTPERVEFQRAGEGYPLDDVIVHARDRLGTPATLEVQVKRTMTFTASDSEFKDIVAQIAKAGKRSDFWTSRYELAIATARHSAKLDGAYQDVLAVARQTAAEVCAARLVRPHAFNADMRQFVATFRRNLELAGTVVDDISIWPWLARIQIHVNDFTAQTSTAAALAREQCLRALADEHVSDAGRLWTALVDIAQAGAVHGGDRTREHLVAELREQGFQLRGEPRSIAGRRALHEASTQALADIGDRIAGVQLTRASYLEEIRTAIDAGARYIEIRGEGGVGKSGVLKHLAALDTMQATPLVLAPNRTPRGGWLSLKAALGFEGSLRELFVDLLAAGCDSVYVDNVDRFEPDERTTANDIIREAALMPGMRLIVTARPRFGREEPSWLPKDALATFGAAMVIQVKNLSGQEMATLRDEASGLADLLSPGHPAVEIASNPYRLSRLVSWSTNAPLRSLRTETDMAQQWWQTADGLLDTTLRAARTLLREMANHALRSEAAFLPNAADHAAIEALARSGSLRDLPDGRIDFQHDVLREWAVANFLHSDPTAWNHLPLTRAASPTHARAVELAARMAIEGNADADAWRQILARLSAAEVHPTWRREALLALVRSEASVEAMDRASTDLRANDGAMLCELVRLVRSIETIDVAANLAASAGLKQPTQIGDWGHIPSSLAWPHLFRWLLDNENDLPPAAIPDIAAAYASWLFFEAITKKERLSGRLLEMLHHWLGEIERSQDLPWDGPRTGYFGDALEEGALKELESNLRNTILLYASKRPDLTVAYLDAQRTRRRFRDELAKLILQFSRAVAPAAPEALAALALHALIPREQKRRREDRLDDHVFGFLDLQFLPASPAQGPFMDLLIAKPEVGLDLIRKLVDHAIKSRYRGQRTDNSDIVIGGPNPRKHPVALTYTWSRDSRDHCVTSALMALEAWAHRRIEAGDNVQAILDQVAPDGAPAAYLLIAVDLLLSHWPKTRTEALPFLGSPELLSLDRQRALHDKQPDFDLFGFGALNKEPTGTATLKDIRTRPSRRAALEDALSQMMHDEVKAERDIVVALVREASDRLGKPAPTAGFFDPAFMAVHALNRLDPVNWEDFEYRTPSGEFVQAKRYVSPPSEAAHLAAQKGPDLSRVNDLNMELAILAKLDKPEEIDDAFLTTAIAWAQASLPSERDTDAGDTRQQAVLTAALLAMQFGGDRRAQLRGWAVSLFTEAIRAPSNMSHAVREGIKFNPPGIAMAGLLFAHAGSAGPDTLEEILQAATRDDVAAAHGLGFAAPSLAETLRPELVRALLRIAFAAEIYPVRNRDFDLDSEVREEQEREGKADHEAALKAAVAREREWLSALDSTPEPPWPTLPPRDSRQSQGMRVHLVDEETEVQTHSFGYQGAATWLRQCLALRPSARHRPWIRELASAVATWTHKANGAGLNQHQRMYAPREWNQVYFELVVEGLHGMSAADIEALLTSPLESYPDEPFLDVAEILVPALDQAYFEGGLPAESAAPIRTALAKRLMRTHGWKRLIGEKSGSVEVHLSPAVAALLFNQCRRFREPGCVLLPKGMERVGPFVPMLLEMARGAPCPYTATLVLDFVAAAPASIAIPMLIAAAQGWLQHFRDYRPFWTDAAVGNRVCTYLASVSDLVSAIGDDGSGRAVLHDLVATLVQLGFPQARPIEIALAQ